MIQWDCSIVSPQNYMLDSGLYNSLDEVTKDELEPNYPNRKCIYSEGDTLQVYVDLDSTVIIVRQVDVDPSMIRED